MFFLHFLPIVEVLFFNLFLIFLCCRRRYSAVRTIFLLALFSAVMLLFLAIFLRHFTFYRNVFMRLSGFIFLIPFRILYREKFSQLFIITCTCWTYTLGILSLSSRFSAVFFSGSLLPMLITESVLFLLTIFPLCRRIIPKYIFIIKHVGSFEKYWNKYIAMNSILYFLALLFLSGVLSDSKSILSILIIALFLSSIYVSYIILYHVVINSLQLCRLDHLTLHDDLTDLGNRTALFRHLTSLCETEKSFCVLLMNLDRFKVINDQCGHAAGDLYLQQFAALSSQIIDEQGKVYRLDGDEFVALYHDEEVPGRLITELKECRAWKPDEPHPFLGVSIGLIPAVPPHPDPEHILRQADAAMYLEKLKRRSVSTPPGYGKHETGEKRKKETAVFRTEPEG